MAKHPKTPPERELEASVKDMNNTLRMEGLVSSAIVFEELLCVFKNPELLQSDLHEGREPA